MNLLVNGEDVNNGYARYSQQTHLKSNGLNLDVCWITLILTYLLWCAYTFFCGQTSVKPETKTHLKIKEKQEMFVKKEN